MRWCRRLVNSYLARHAVPAGPDPEAVPADGPDGGDGGPGNGGGGGPDHGGHGGGGPNDGVGDQPDDGGHDGGAGANDLANDPATSGNDTNVIIGEEDESAGHVEFIPAPVNPEVILFPDLLFFDCRMCLVA